MQWTERNIMIVQQYARRARPASAPPLPAPYEPWLQFQRPSRRERFKVRVPQGMVNNFVGGTMRLTGMPDNTAPKPQNSTDANGHISGTLQQSGSLGNFAEQAAVAFDPQSTAAPREHNFAERTPEQRQPSPEQRAQDHSKFVEQWTQMRFNKAAAPHAGTSSDRVKRVAPQRDLDLSFIEELQRFHAYSKPTYKKADVLTPHVAGGGALRQQEVSATRRDMVTSANEVKAEPKVSAAPAPRGIGRGSNEAAQLGRSGQHVGALSTAGRLAYIAALRSMPAAGAGCSYVPTQAAERALVKAQMVPKRPPPPRPF